MTANMPERPYQNRQHLSIGFIAIGGIARLLEQIDRHTQHNTSLEHFKFNYSRTI
jgi:hypothetical protein